MPSKLTPNQLVANRQRTHAVHLARFTAAEQKKADKMIRKMYQDLWILYNSTSFGKKTPTQQKRIKEFLAVARATIRGSYSQFNKDLTPTLVELAGIESDFAVESVNAVYGQGFIEATFTANQLRALTKDVLINGGNKTQWMQRLAGNDLAAYTQVIQQGVLNGHTNATVAANLRDIAGKSRRHIDTFTRTAIQSVSNKAANDTWAQNSEVIDGIQQISTLDLKTSDICMAYSGAVWTLPDYKPVPGDGLPWDGGPPRHPNCRSRTTPVVAPFRKLTQDGKVKDISGLPKRTRAAVVNEVRTKGGKVILRDVKHLPNDVTFDEFLKEMTKGKTGKALEAGIRSQKKLLGAGRLKLWNQGKITTKDLVDFRGRPLTLKQLRERIGD